MDDNQQNEEAHKARRREQVRLAQQRRRDRLAQGVKSQVNIFLSPDAIARLDALALLWGVERQEVIERLLVNLELNARANLDDAAKPKTGAPHSDVRGTRKDEPRDTRR